MYTEVARMTSAKCYSFLAGHRWLTSVILATHEAEIRRIGVRSQLEQTVHKTLSQKSPSHKKGWWSGSRWRSWVQAPAPQIIIYNGFLWKGNGVNYFPFFCALFQRIEFFIIYKYHSYIILLAVVGFELRTWYLLHYFLSHLASSQRLGVFFVCFF
jgi:hypothetical protein